MDTPPSIFAIVLWLFANSFYVAAKFVLVKARGLRIELLAAEGNFLLRVLNMDEHRVGKAHITYQEILTVEDQPSDATPSKDDIASDEAVTESKSVDNTDLKRE